MPYLDVPERGLKMYYVVNARVAELSFCSKEDPLCEPIDPAKPTLVFLHCGTLSIASFSNQFADPRLRQAFNLVAVDSRCCGLTTGTERETFTLEDFADDILCVLDALNLTSYSLFGEGVVGCVEAVWIAIKRPDKVRSVMMASPGWPEESAEMRVALDGIGAWFCENKEGKGDGTGTVSAECMAAGCEYFFGDQPRLEQRRAEYAIHNANRYGANHSSHDLLHVTGISRRTPISAALLSTIYCPMIILQGAKDTVVSPIAATKQWAELLVNAAGGCDIRIISDGPHLIAYADYNIVNRMLLAFVTRRASVC